MTSVWVPCFGHFAGVSFGIKVQFFRKQKIWAPLVLALHIAALPAANQTGAAVSTLPYHTP